MENIIVNFENLNISEREQLLAIIEKANKPRSEVWKPKYNEKCFILDGANEIIKQQWQDTGYNNRYYNIGNILKTKEEAVLEAKHREIKAKLERFAIKNNEYVANWNNGLEKKYMLCYKYNKDCIEIEDYRYFYFADTIYFTSKEIAQTAINHIGEEDLKKYYFKVKE